MKTGIAIESEMTESGNFILGKRYFFTEKPPMFGYGENVWETVDEFGYHLAYHDEDHLRKQFGSVE